MHKLIMLAAAGIITATAFAAERLDPAESAEISNYGSNERLIGRFDLSRVANAGKIAKATLHLSGMTPPAEVEIRPLATAWGAAAEGLAKRQAEGVWRPEDLKLHDYKVAEELFLVGLPQWEWAARGVKKWTAPGGDAGEIIARIKPAAEGMSADVTALVRGWQVKPESNFGLLVRLASEGKGLNLRGLSMHLMLEGEGVMVDRTLRLDAAPAWLPKTYRAAHPRLPYPTKEWLDALKADPKRLADLVKRANAVELDKAKSLQIPDFVLAQVVAPTPARAELLNKAVDAKFPNHGGFEQCYALAVLYDWGYEFLTVESRARLAQRLDRMCTNEEDGSSATIISPFNDVGASRFGCGLLWAALAIYPDLPGAQQHLWRAKSYYIDTSIPVWHRIMGDDGGYWHELHGYYLGDCLGRTVHRVLSAWSSAAGQDLYRENPWLENMLYFGIYSTRPDMYRIHLGDTKVGEREYGEPPICLECFPALARRYDNPYGLAWVQRFGGRKADGVTPTEYPWGAPFAREAKAKSPESLPLVRHSDGLGVVNMRSDWTEDATCLWFKCGPSFWSHSHFDSGTFEIFKRGALAIDAGNYAYGYHTEHYRFYGRMSVAHNVITVTDPAEPPNKPGKGAVAYPNDGGQRFTAGESGTPGIYSVANWKARADEFDAGKIVAFQTTPQFTYVAGDVTRAYTNSKSGAGDGPSRGKRVRKMIRSLVYLPPDHVVIFDQVESFNRDFPKRWLLHTVNEPKADAAAGVTTVERADLCFRFSAWDKSLKHAITATADNPFFKEHPDVKFYGSYQPQLYQYDGVMFVRTLLPADAKVEVIGGPGKECWLNGKNYDSAEGSEVEAGGKAKKVSFRPYTGEGETGRYRIEISPGTPAENDPFLNVIQVGEKGKSPKPTTAKLLDGKGATAVQVELLDGKSAIVTFKPGLGGHIKIEQAGKTLADADLTTDVQPNVKIE